MGDRNCKRISVLVLSVALIDMGTPAIGHAGIISTQTYVEAARRDADPRQRQRSVEPRRGACSG